MMLCSLFVQVQLEISSECALNEKSLSKFTEILNLISENFHRIRTPFRQLFSNHTKLFTNLKVQKGSWSKATASKREKEFIKTCFKMGKKNFSIKNPFFFQRCEKSRDKRIFRGRTLTRNVVSLWKSIFSRKGLRFVVTIQRYLNHDRTLTNGSKTERILTLKEKSLKVS